MPDFSKRQSTKDDFTSVLLKYWRNCLADADRTAFDPRDFDDSEEAVGIPLDDVANGRISRIKAEGLITVYKNKYDKKAKKNQKRNNKVQYSRAKGDEEEEINEIKVLVCPIIAASIPEHGRPVDGKDRPITPVWIPAMLHRNGHVIPVLDEPPWIPRKLLEPMEADSLTLGDLEASDGFLGANPFPPQADDQGLGVSWGDVWRYSNEMLRAVAGRTLENFPRDNFKVWSLSYILLDRPRGAAHEVIKFYDQFQLDLEKGRTVLPALLGRYTSLQDNELVPLLSGQEEIQKSAEHLGQMGRAFSLSESQREALHHAMAMKDGEILAVNGPPGTGKTTLIQSVVATLWVEAALHGGEPPIIVATSTNNQAVTNVIDSFGGAEDNSPLLSSRWIPDIKSYGLFCPATSKEAEAGTYQISRQKDMGFYLARDVDEGDLADEEANIERWEFVYSAEEYFLDHCRRYAEPPIPDVKSAVEYCHQRLTGVAAEIKSGSEIWLKLKQLTDRLSSDYDVHVGIEEYFRKLSQNIEQCRTRAQELERARQGWSKYNSDGPWWVVLLNFIPQLMKILPGAKQYLADWNESYFFEIGLKVEGDRSDAVSIRDFFHRKRDEVREEERSFSTALDRVKQDKSDLDQARQHWNDWRARNGLHAEPSVLSELLESLDTTLRYVAFKLATHYWEGRWLLEIKDYLTRPQEYLRKPDERQFAEQEQKKRWRRYAKLTPCVVVTLYKLEPFFNAFDYAASDEESKRIPLYKFIDLLIIDEAGQVAPDVAGVNFSLARKALVVGDTMQLKPVRGITPGIDLANMKKHSVAVSEEEIRAVDAAGFSVSEGKIMSGGNVMKIAQRASRYRKPDARVGERGMFLAEHRRCAKEIIQYCNELAYEGRLIPMRECKLDLTLPRMGYAHIPGNPEKVGNSRRNPIEGQTIVRWIEEHQELLKFRYNDLPIEEIVAIVTPFRPQAQLIKSELAKRGALGGIRVGTVHVLQGAECPVVLFSPVYGVGENPRFMNAEPNMLNVAVSRAKDTFLVFGNIGVLRQSRKGSPSEILARYLVANDENEITDIELPRREDVGLSIGVYHLGSLEDHRTILASSFRSARRGIWITSPYIRGHTIDADDTENLIAEAINRGISVTIYTDPSLNYENEKRQIFNPEYIEGVRKLKRCGATVMPVWFDHSKTLIVDDEVLIEGSFNWFSARRDNYQRRERSIEYRG